MINLNIFSIGHSSCFKMYYLRKIFHKLKLVRCKSSQEWLARQTADPYVEKAKMQNYRCRSAFKLLEIDEKTHILSPGMSVVDLGASPGSWTQVAVRKTNADGLDKDKNKGSVLAVDLLQIFPIDGATILSNTDFTTTEAQNKIMKVLDGNKVDLVLSDMAPSASGIKDLDKDRIIALCYMALRFAALVSKNDAAFLFKVWNGKEVPVLESDLGKFYKKIKILKPNASRSDSAEIFILGKGFKGLADSPLKQYA